MVAAIQTRDWPLFLEPVPREPCLMSGLLLSTKAEDGNKEEGQGRPGRGWNGNEPWFRGPWIFTAVSYFHHRGRQMNGGPPL